MSIAKFNKWQSVDGVTRNAVLQVVSKVAATSYAHADQTFGDITDMFLAITPTSATSKIHISMSPNIIVSRTGNTSLVALRLLRDSTVIYTPHSQNATGYFGAGILAGTNTTGLNLYGPHIVEYVDSPATTSEITYKLQVANYLSSTTTTVNFQASGYPGCQASIVLMEIAQ